MWEPFLSEQNKYQKIRLLGEGSSSRVYLVREQETKEYYAVKVSKNKELLRKETEILQKLSGEGFPKWKDYFEGEWGYLVMEYIDGVTLQVFLEKKGTVNPVMAKCIMKEILQSLHKLHHMDPPILYRDMKPENIMIRKDGRICLIDLGGGAADKCRVGNYGYGAPEQFWEGAEVGPESDLYGAGKVLAFLLTGKDPCQPPYDMLAYCEKDKRISGEIYGVLQRSLAVEAQGRYDSAESFWRELEKALDFGAGKKRKKKGKKLKIIYEKCIWKSEYQRIF